MTFYNNWRTFLQEDDIDEATAASKRGIELPSVMEELKKYSKPITELPTHYIQFSNVNKLGINPSSHYNTPLGIYSYPVNDVILDELEKVTDGKLSPQEKTDLKLNVVGKIPEILLDNTDRNRTSSFAFTGNKFEFRAVGSTTNCAKPMVVLNTIVAKQLKDFKNEVDKLVDKQKMKKDDAIFNVLREYIKASKKIRFEGDGYSAAWQKEALKRKLSNHSSTPEALNIQLDKRSIAVFEEMAVMNSIELKARHEIEIEEYIKRVQIESRVLGDMARNHIIPTSIRYQNLLIKNVEGLKNIFAKDYENLAQEQLALITQISEYIGTINKDINAMVDARKSANKLDVKERAVNYKNEVLPFFDTIRYASDKLELLVEDKLWPLAKNRELLSLS